MTANPKHTALMLARYDGYCRGLRFAASIARQSGDRQMAIKLTEVARSDLAYRLAQMDEVDAQVVYAAAVCDCTTPVPAKRNATSRAVLALVSNEERKEKQT